ncbi:PP2C family protein-serine/threonine phosphatase [Streptomyces sp. NPDC088337]|uniref:PP2C family protein-serine/threonine phosphatase n=1 Tax=unclassified Streptomyces TaxID=2593676 RepID=UPI002DD99362|nr:PP2C family protein-serine/threonine phosphatase [Streptomyces sp. NBC_01788]
MALPDGDEWLTGILGEGHMCGFDQLPALVAKHAARAGMGDARVFLPDLRRQLLREVTGQGLDAGAGGETYEVDGTLPGRAFAGSQLLPGGDGEPRRWWVPILGGTERLGVLRVDLAPGVGPERAAVLASLIALLLTSKRPHSDSYARLVRTEAMNVAAEMQWNLMPPLCFANHAVAIVAAMEPAYAIGGDAFDYAVAGDQIHLAVYDAMGHDSRAGLTANLAVAACRNQRRQGSDLVAIGEKVEEVLVEHFGHSAYVTAVLARLDSTTGVLSWINRGHPAPVLIRGGRWITTLRCPPSHPLGTELDVPAALCREQLEPGDRVVLYTDGVTEARDRCGHEFGLDGLTDFIVRHYADGLPFAETMRRLMHAIVDHHAGQPADDATVLCLEWLGPSRNTQLCPQNIDQE